MGDVVSGITGAMGASKAADQSKKSSKYLQKTMAVQGNIINTAAHEYITNLASLSSGYNP